MSDTKVTNEEKMNLIEIIEDMFLVLTNKEKEVIVKRFSLDNKPKMTLEKIGQSFSVTRERVRQIEKIALGKLRRTVETTKLYNIKKVSNNILSKHGGILLESKLLAEIINTIGSEENTDLHILKLALNINADISSNDKNNLYRQYWRNNTVRVEDIKSVIKVGINTLNKKGDVVSDAEVIKAVQSEYENFTENFIISAFEIDKRVKRTPEGFGLASWRHINPRSIRDKAHIVLKNAGEPLHFVEIANRIMSSEFDRKVVTTQAVHNELIRYDQFVLVGRGLYALKDWGFKKGTVSEVIESLLRKKAPLTKKEIIDGVLKQRKVKKGTISLNLQKNPQFIRVGRAVYDLKENS
ncbi:hypothetical protein GF376_03705 [Candidatus Peregrinibacteria bacterium]|nr:hypothetical protein [Candidatus Peregrinibacteria bacterium]